MAYGPSLKKHSKKPLLIGLAIVGLLVVLAIGGFIGYRYAKDYSVKDPAGATMQPSNVDEVEVVVQDNQSPTPTPTTTSSIPAAEQQASTGITITSPVSNAVIKGGTKLEGSAPSGYRTVSYRLQSDDRGLVGQGELALVNNKYSGTVSAGGASGNGFIEVFVVDVNGREIKHTKVVVRYE